MTLPLNNKYNDLSWEQKIINLYYIAKGLAAIHKSNLAHKDFHSGNIVNESMCSSYITDFGLCRPVFQDSSSKGIFGVLPYIAPEVFYGEKYTIESDIYSFGIIMSEVFTGYPPYHDIPHNFRLATQICLGRRPEIRCKVSQSRLGLINKCLDADPQSRPTAEALVDMLAQFYNDLIDKTTELYKQVEEIKNLDDNSLIYNQANQTKSTRFNYQTHKQAIYTSQFLNFQKLPKPVNAGEHIISQNIGLKLLLLVCSNSM
ncbi:kinase-like domain-containing protein [Gigaspora rosea]|uniref:mitogen-activated protein kinase kinase n=1 Tax=Gigaspora rosea TaxID=44941 RepID=A0A397ULP1_9GLOM|nr:kinase-like domain-containing protein [Gigaspora rosea]